MLTVRLALLVFWLQALSLLFVARAARVFCRYSGEFMGEPPTPQDI
jgi:hypothetical protein